MKKKYNKIKITTIYALTKHKEKRKKICWIKNMKKNTLQKNNIILNLRTKVEKKCFIFLEFSHLDAYRYRIFYYNFYMYKLLFKKKRRIFKTNM